MFHYLNIASSTLASTLRGWRGTGGSRRNEFAPSGLILFDREGCPECRLVREALTGLNFDVTIVPCPIGGRNLAGLRNQSGFGSVPVLYDGETEEKRHGADEIVNYLFRRYRDSSPTDESLMGLKNSLLSKAATLSRLNAGTKARPAKPAEQALTLYSFESSPFSRPVRELLCELEIPYLLINLGKQQWSDMGPAKARFSRKPYSPLKHSKRETFFKQYGDVQVPFLVDQNTGVEMFESKDILRYLRKTYFVHSK